MRARTRLPATRLTAPNSPLRLSFPTPWIFGNPAHATPTLRLESVSERIAKARSDSIEPDRTAKAAANCTEMALIVPQVAPA